MQSEKHLLRNLAILLRTSVTLILCSVFIEIVSSDGSPENLQKLQRDQQQHGERIAHSATDTHQLLAKHIEHISALDNLEKLLNNKLREIENIVYNRQHIVHSKSEDEVRQQEQALEAVRELIRLHKTLLTEIPLLRRLAAETRSDAASVTQRSHNMETESRFDIGHDDNANEKILIPCGQQTQKCGHTGKGKAPEIHLEIVELANKNDIRIQKNITKSSLVQHVGENKKMISTHTKEAEEKEVVKNAEITDLIVGPLLFEGDDLREFDPNVSADIFAENVAKQEDHSRVNTIVDWPAAVPVGENSIVLTSSLHSYNHDIHDKEIKTSAMADHPVEEEKQDKKIVKEKAKNTLEAINTYGDVGLDVVVKSDNSLRHSKKTKHRQNIIFEEDRSSAESENHPEMKYDAFFTVNGMHAFNDFSEHRIPERSYNRDHPKDDTFSKDIPHDVGLGNDLLSIIPQKEPILYQANAINEDVSNEHEFETQLIDNDVLLEPGNDVIKTHQLDQTLDDKFQLSPANPEENTEDEHYLDRIEHKPMNEKANQYAVTVKGQGTHHGGKYKDLLSGIDTIPKESSYKVMTVQQDGDHQLKDNKQSYPETRHERNGYHRIQVELDENYRGNGVKGSPVEKNRNKYEHDLNGYRSIDWKDGHRYGDGYRLDKNGYWYSRDGFPYDEDGYRYDRYGYLYDRYGNRVQYGHRNYWNDGRYDRYSGFRPYGRYYHTNVGYRYDDEDHRYERERQRERNMAEAKMSRKLDQLFSNMFAPVK